VTQCLNFLANNAVVSFIHDKNGLKTFPFFQTPTISIIFREGLQPPLKSMQHNKKIKLDMKDIVMKKHTFTSTE
jgi:hypothetical protein